jgi:hypothetical protein
MMRLLHFVACLFLVGCGRSDQSAEAPTHDLIANAEASSRYTILPAVIQRSPDKAFLQGVRDRGYAFCYRPAVTKVDVSCSLEQDAAIHSIVLILMMSGSKDLINQTEKQRWVTAHPEEVKRVRQYCHEIYQDAGSNDARILNVCLSNLGDWSSLLPNPFGVAD